MNLQVPKMLLSLNDYESDIELLGVTPNEMPVTESETDAWMIVTIPQYYWVSTWFYLCGFLSKYQVVSYLSK